MMKTTYLDPLYERYLHSAKCVSLSIVSSWMEQVMNVIFPTAIEIIFIDRDEFIAHMEGIERQLIQILDCSLKSSSLQSTTVADNFFKELHNIQSILDKDIEAIYQGDPAAQSKEEVIRCYPGIRAIAAYRIAHFFHRLNVPILPRMITECAHSQTGIDIHPGAEIDAPFCIDHGTGIVIGATAKIGPHVKIYQGVTLGGLSVKKEDANKKRHPTIEEKVIIYAGATILGGDTVIGSNCTIGGNTFITKSVDSNTIVYHTPKNREKRESWN